MWRQMVKSWDHQVMLNGNHEFKFTMIDRPDDVVYFVIPWEGVAVIEAFLAETKAENEAAE